MAIYILLGVSLIANVLVIYFAFQTIKNLSLLCKSDSPDEVLMYKSALNPGTDENVQEKDNSPESQGYTDILSMPGEEFLETIRSVSK